MQILDANKVVEIYLPYYFKIGNIFSQDFLVTSLKQVQTKNQCPMSLVRSAQTNEVQAQCSADPQKCQFKLIFTQEKSQCAHKGYQLKTIIPQHSCKPSNSNDQKRILRNRKNEIRSLRKQLFDILQQRIPIYGCQSSKVILTQLAIRLDKYPNFLTRGVNKTLQQRIRKKFDNQINRLRKYVYSKKQRPNNPTNAQLEFIYQEEADSDSYNDSSFVKANDLSPRSGTNNRK